MGDLGAFRGEGNWGVSTLQVNPITRAPTVTLFERDNDAIEFAQQRALSSGLTRRAGGRVMYVIEYPEIPEGSERAEGVIRYRVLRGQRGKRMRRGGGVSPDPQQQVLVFSSQGLLPDGRNYRWSLERHLTVDVHDLEEEREKAERARGSKALTVFDRYGDT